MPPARPDAHAHAGQGPEWFARPDGPERGRGLRFACTQCGHCCSGPPGYVRLDDDEIDALARRLHLPTADFLERYTHVGPHGRSLNEVPSPHGFDCVFLDRTSHPGRALCGIYEDRPAQCRTWPFWPSNLRTADTWARAAQRCPGMNTGTLVPVTQVRIRRDRVDI